MEAGFSQIQSQIKHTLEVSILLHYLCVFIRSSAVILFVLLGWHFAQFPICQREHHVLSTAEAVNNHIIQGEARKGQPSNTWTGSWTVQWIKSKHCTLSYVLRKRTSKSDICIIYNIAFDAYTHMHWWFHNHAYTHVQHTHTHTHVYTYTQIHMHTHTHTHTLYAF